MKKKSILLTITALVFAVINITVIHTTRAFELNNKKLNNKKLNNIIFTSQVVLNTVIILCAVVIVAASIYMILKTNKKNKVSTLEQKEIAVEKESTKELEETDEDGIFIKYNYGFSARLHQAPELTKERYSELKNKVLSYFNVDVKNSFKYERFMYKNKPVFKAWVHGENIKLYFNIDPKSLEGTKYNIEDVSYAKMHQSTPSLFVVNGPRLLDYAKELISIALEGKTTVDPNYIEKDYKLPYLDKDELIEKGLIKDNTK